MPYILNSKPEIKNSNAYMGNEQVACMSEVVRGSRDGWGLGRAHDLSMKASATHLLDFCQGEAWSQYGWIF